jgi:hypothetical protein
LENHKGYYLRKSERVIRGNAQRKHRKRHSYTIALRALFESRDNNPAHEEFFNSLISSLKKKNQCWDRMSVHD